MPSKALAEPELVALLSKAPASKKAAKNAKKKAKKQASATEA